VFLSAGGCVPFVFPPLQKTLLGGGDCRPLFPFLPAILLAGGNLGLGTCVFPVSVLGLFFCPTGLVFLLGGDACLLGSLLRGGKRLSFDRDIWGTFFPLFFPELSCGPFSFSYPFSSTKTFGPQHPSGSSTLHVYHFTNFFFSRQWFSPQEVFF